LKAEGNSTPFNSSFFQAFGFPSAFSLQPSAFSLQPDFSKGNT
jgi:hypothetical protein